MKKILYFLPAILGVAFYIFLGMAVSFKAINPFVWITLGILWLSAFLMVKNIWLGSLLGFLIGILLIYMGNQETGQIIKETPFGIVMCIYYVICAIACYKRQ